jgi:hypothetical protein
MKRIGTPERLKFNDRLRAAYEMRAAKLTWREIAAEIGVHEKHVPYMAKKYQRLLAKRPGQREAL